MATFLRVRKISQELCPQLILVVIYLWANLSKHKVAYPVNKNGNNLCRIST